MRRREFITLLGSTAIWPISARAQQTGKLPTIGFLGSDPTVWSPWAAAFVGRLHELGWIEGRTVAIEYRWDEGRPEREAEIATEFVALKVDVIVTNALAVTTLKQATAVIPIVFPIAPDPVGGGLIASLARPGGNVTGLSLEANDLAGKRLELLREVVPGLHRLAIMFDGNHPSTVSEAEDVEATARKLGIEVAPLNVRRSGDIASEFATLNGQADGLYIVADALTAANSTPIITLALAAQLPTILNTSNYVRAGALMSYGPDLTDQFRRAANVVDKILHGTKPSDIPVEQPTKFELVVNLKTAKALGVTVPGTVLARADEVIE